MYRITPSGTTYYAVEMSLDDPHARDDIITLLAEDNVVILTEDLEAYVKEFHVDVEEIL